MMTSEETLQVRHQIMVIESLTVVCQLQGRLVNLYLTIL